MKRQAMFLLMILGFPVVHGEAQTVGGSLTVYGPRIFERSTGQPVTVQVTFHQPSVTPPYLLRVRNGAPDGTNRVSSATLRLNGGHVLTPANFNQQVAFLETTVLLFAMNTLEVRLASAPGSYLTIEITASDTTAPVIILYTPAPDLITSASRVTVAGRIEGNAGTAATVNGVPVLLSADGSFTTEADLPSEGANSITVAAVSAGGYRSEITRTVIRDTGAPLLAIISPEDGRITSASDVMVEGTVSDPTPVSLTVQGEQVPVDSLGRFSSRISLIEGMTMIAVDAIDAAGNSAGLVRSIRRDTTPPILAVISPADGVETFEATVRVDGTVFDSTSVVLTVNGLPVVVELGAFSDLVSLVPGSNLIVVRAVDAAGNESSIHLTVTRRDPYPPHPATITPPVDSTLLTVAMASAVEFLFTGPDALQTGVAEGTIRRTCPSVVRGAMIDRLGRPLPGVTVRVAGHPEFGQTLSRGDGAYDLVVNGGRTLTLTFEKPGFFPAARDVDPRCLQFVFADTVALVEPDPVVTTITFAQPRESARGSVVTDADGTRQAAMVFEQGTQALMVFPNDSSVPLSSMNVRITEYSVGPTGVHAMPAALPVTSGYTYCANLTADEALASGATRVLFNRPVMFYVDNFIGFPVGMKIPVGYYDFPRKEWIPLEDGRVIQILQVVDGCAVLAVDSAGVASDPARLSAFGITDGERCHLATLYTPGQSIMRTPINYFGMYDKNCGIIAPEGAEEPPPLSLQEDSYVPRYPSPGIAQDLNARNMTMGTTFPLSGLPFGLRYESDRHPGHKTELVIPLSGQEIPEGILSMHVEVHVAGRRFTLTLPPEPNQTTRILWDGKDVYGRFIPGSHTVRTRVGYTYPGAYQLPTYIRNNFGLMSGTRIPLIRARQNVTLWRESESILTMLDNRAAGFGGWNLTAHHAFDTDRNVLYLGTGQERVAVRLGGEVETIAGNGVLGDGPDNVPASQTAIYPGVDLAFGPDRSIYVVGLHRIRRIGPDGIIRPFAGTGNTSGPSGDGGPALQATMVTPRGIAVGRDGSVYIVEAGRRVIRKVDPAGIITTIAGTGIEGFSGDGGPATQARLREPWAIAVGPDGSTYFSDQNFVNTWWLPHLEHRGRIRKIDQSGIITTVAGGGSSYNLDGGIAVTQALDLIHSLSFGPDGSLFFTSRRDSIFQTPTIPSTVLNFPRTVIYRLGSDGKLSRVGGTRASIENNENGVAAREATFGLMIRDGNASPMSCLAVGPDGRIAVSISGYQIVRMIDQDGIANTNAGVLRWPRGFFNGDGRLALHTGFSDPEQLRFGPDAFLYVFDKRNNRIRRIRPSAPATSGMAFTVPSPDGSQMFHFDVSGRHRKTTDALTGRALFTFGYDSTGWLVSIMDRDSLVSRIERNSQGKPVAIISPYGVRTELVTDGDGYLIGTVSPQGETSRFSYVSGGLLGSTTAPLGNGSVFSYDSTGRLLLAHHSGGSASSLERLTTPGGYQVKAGTAMGRTVETLTEFLSSGARRLTTVDARGRRTVATLMPDGTDSLLTPDATLAVQRRSFDPRFGIQVPVPESTLVRLPSGLTSRQRRSRTISLVVGQQVKGITDSTISNGRISTEVYNDVQKLNTVLSPEGRRRLRFLNTRDQIIKDSIPGIVSTTYEYDPFGRMTAMRQRGRVARYGYDSAGRLFAATDPLGRTDSFFYDNAGRIIRQVLAGGREVRYRYDANGNVVSITPPGRPAHDFAYDPGDRPQEYLPPAVPVDSLTPTRFEYNPDNQLTRTLFADSGFIEISYDPLDGTPASISFDRGNITFAYDSATGNPASLIGPDSIRIQYAYDGSLPTSESWSGPVHGTVSMTYDADFRVIRQTVNATDSVDFLYDKDNNIVGAGLLKLRRNALNGLVERDTVGNITGLLSYTPLGELSGMEYRFGALPLYQTNYQRDSLSRITRLTETIQGVTRTYRYEYDPSGRLWQVRLGDSLTAEYTYDPNGNRLTAHRSGVVDSGRYDDQDRTVEYGGCTYEYTRGGSLRRRVCGGDTTGYVYDAYGNLVSVRTGHSPEIEYLPDPLNRRIGVRRNGVVTSRYLYSGDLRPVAELDSAGGIASRFVYATRANVPEYMVRGGVTYRMITDHLGSVRLVVNASTGAVSHRLDYDEFGRVLFDTNPGFQPFGYAGGLYDPETGLVRFGARDYDAATGRWTAKDPIGFGGGDGNLYGYAGNNAVNANDVTGRDWNLLSLAYLTVGTASEIATYEDLFENLVLATQRTANLDVVGGVVASALGFDNVLFGALGQSVSSVNPIIGFGVDLWSLLSYAATTTPGPEPDLSNLSVINRMRERVRLGPMNWRTYSYYPDQ